MTNRNIDTILAVLATGVLGWWLGYGPVPILVAQAIVAVLGVSMGAWFRSARAAWRG